MTAPGAVQPAEPPWVALQRRGNEHLAQLARQPAGASLEELTILQQACACYSEALRITPDGEPSPASEVLDRHVNACVRIAHLLDGMGEHAGVIAALQEAADIYGLIGTVDSAEHREECAREIVNRTAMLSQKPDERLYLLVTHFERRLLRLEIEGAGGSERARVCMQLASLFLRSAHPAEAAIYLRRAIDHLPVPETRADTQLAAGAHYRLGTVLAEAMGQNDKAVQHLKTAIALYTQTGRLSGDAREDCLAASRLLASINRRRPPS